MVIVQTRPRPPIRHVIWVIFALVMAGCFGLGGKKAPQEEDPVGPLPPETRHTHFEQPPAWQLGDYWEIRDPDGVRMHIIVDQNPTDWIVATNDEETAFYDARFDISLLGPVRKSDLAGSQQENRVQYFQWPMVANTSWKTVWDDEEVEVTALGSSNNQTFAFEARRVDDGSLFATYNYDAGMRWFQQLTFLDRDGQVSFEMTWLSAGNSYTGKTVSWDLETVYTERESDGFGQIVYPFEVSPTATDVWWTFEAACSQGAFMVTVYAIIPWVLPLRGIHEGGACPQNVTSEESLGPPIAPQPGPGEERWFLSMQSQPTTDGWYEITVLARTLHETKYVGGKPVDQTPSEGVYQNTPLLPAP